MYLIPVTDWCNGFLLALLANVMVSDLASLVVHFDSLGKWVVDASYVPHDDYIPIA